MASNGALRALNYLRDNHPKIDNILLSVELQQVRWHPAWETLNLVVADVEVGKSGEVAQRLR
jgi:hypothetical protein